MSSSEDSIDGDAEWKHSSDDDEDLKKTEFLETELDAMKPTFDRESLPINNPVKTLEENEEKPDENDEKADETDDDESSDYEDYDDSSAVENHPILTKEKPVKDIDNNIDVDIKESENSSEFDYPEAKIYAPKKAPEDVAPLDMPSGGLLTRLKNIFTYVKSQFDF